MKTVYNINDVNQPLKDGIMTLSCQEGSAYMVYVLNKDGQPFMPTNRHGKVKHLLRKGKAKVVTSQ